MYLLQVAPYKGLSTDMCRSYLDSNWWESRILSRVWSPTYMFGGVSFSSSSCAACSTEEALA
eukprot:521414-Prorocentrum_minimum.AAC.1